MHEDPHTRQLLQFFEKGYERLNQAPADKTERVSSLICNLLLSILLAFVPAMPYGVTTFASIIYDAFDPREALHAACLSLKRPSCTYWKRFAKTVPNEYRPVSKAEETEKPAEKKKKPIEKEYVFVDFNAWECAACVHITLL